MWIKYIDLFMFRGLIPFGTSFYRARFRARDGHSIYEDGKYAVQVDKRRFIYFSSLPVYTSHRSTLKAHSADPGSA